jgi:hypothetical protein
MMVSMLTRDLGEGINHVKTGLQGLKTREIIKNGAPLRFFFLWSLINQD